MDISAPSELNAKQLKPYQKRKFVPSSAALTELPEVTTLYEKLLAQPVTSSEDFKAWILDRSELESAITQEDTILYIRMTCQTDDKARAKAYQDFVENIQPAITAYDDKLNKKYLEYMAKYPSKDGYFDILTRETKTDIELFADENIPLQTQVNLLSQEYQTVIGAMAVTFEGKEQTLPQMAKYLLEQDRDLRERAWSAVTERRLQNKDKLEMIFDKLLKLRVQIAQNAKCKNFIDYKFRALHRFDYTPEDCKKYHESIEKLIVPIWADILNDRRKKMKLEKLKPWDTSVDPLGRAPLKPFEKVDTLIGGCKNIFDRIDKELGAQFTQMDEEGLLDLASRKGKAPGGYNSALDETRKSFIFMNAVGTDDDVRTLLHEGGHAFHTRACAAEPLLDYRHGPMEFNEVASMAMELLGAEYLEEFYSPQEIQRSRRDHFEDIIYILGWVAVVDSFQHWIYANPKHTPQERKEAWVKAYRRFGGDSVDWAGHEEARGYLWHRQLHIFEVPFYYIEYGIAQLGALQLWRNAKKDFRQAVKDYKHALSFGGARSLPELYKAAGIKFDFSPEVIAPLMAEVKKELAQL